MSNMSYCKFENTLDDLRDCEETLNEFRTLQNMMEDEDTNDSEKDAMKEMIELCREITVNYYDELDNI